MSSDDLAVPEPTLAVHSPTEDEAKRFARLLITQPGVYSAFALAFTGAVETRNPADTMQTWLNERGYGTTLGEVLAAIETVRRDEALAWRGPYGFVSEAGREHLLIIEDSQTATLDGAPLVFAFEGQRLTWEQSPARATSGSIAFSIDASVEGGVSTARVDASGTIGSDVVSAKPLVVRTSGSSQAPSMGGFAGHYATKIYTSATTSQPGDELVVQPGSSGTTFLFAKGLPIMDAVLSTDEAAHPVLKWTDATSTQTSGSITFYHLPGAGQTFNGWLAPTPNPLPADKNFTGAILSPPSPYNPTVTYYSSWGEALVGAILGALILPVGGGLLALGKKLVEVCKRRPNELTEGLRELRAETKATLDHQRKALEALGERSSSDFCSNAEKLERYQRRLERDLDVLNQELSEHEKTFNERTQEIDRIEKVEKNKLSELLEAESKLKAEQNEKAKLELKEKAERLRKDWLKEGKEALDKRRERDKIEVERKKLEAKRQERLRVQNLIKRGI